MKIVAYNKEYYEKHKEQMKKARDKYRKNPINKDKINEKKREKYKNLSNEDREKLLQKFKEYRAVNEQKSRIYYRLAFRKRQIRRYLEEYEKLEHKMFMLKMVDTWTSEDYKYSDELFAEMHKFKEKIDLKTKEIEELKVEMEKLDGGITN